MFCRFSAGCCVEPVERFLFGTLRSSHLKLVYMWKGTPNTRSRDNKNDSIRVAVVFTKCTQFSYLFCSGLRFCKQNDSSN